MTLPLKDSSSRPHHDKLDGVKKVRQRKSPKVDIYAEARKRLELEEIESAKRREEEIPLIFKQEIGIHCVGLRGQTTKVINEVASVTGLYDLEIGGDSVQGAVKLSDLPQGVAAFLMDGKNEGEITFTAQRTSEEGYTTTAESPNHMKAITFTTDHLNMDKPELVQLTLKEQVGSLEERVKKHRDGATRTVTFNDRALNSVDALTDLRIIRLDDDSAISIGGGYEYGRAHTPTPFTNIKHLASPISETFGLPDVSLTPIFTTQKFK